MSEDEKRWNDEHFGFLDSAIEKSRLPGKRTAYRCVKNADWLPENHEIGTEYVDPAYGSFSLSLENALRYSNENNIIIFQLPITEEMKALYIDEEEYETLRPRNCQYRIRNIYKIKIMISGKLKIATIYRIEEMEGKIDARRNDE
ncbi:ADP-ribosyltransferase [Methanimicrococcus blatticola]|nr:ADP-ribosyltransferase [Methanimicrococcus blatticola]MBZ3936287.1 hypothetical protein [Methanimicrococcus blatticola]